MWSCHKLHALLQVRSCHVGLPVVTHSIAVQVINDTLQYGDDETSTASLI